MYCLILFQLSFFPPPCNVCTFFHLSLWIPFLLSLAFFISYMLFSPFLSLPPSLPLPLPCDSRTPLLTFPTVSKETGQNGSKSTMLFVVSKLHKILLDLSLYLPSSQYLSSLLEIDSEGQKHV